MVDGLTVKDALVRWALEGKVTHAVGDVHWPNSHCPQGLCGVIERRSNCGSSTISVDQCTAIGCAWCPSAVPGEQNCINILVADGYK